MTSTSRSRLAESLEPYLAEDARATHAKLSITLPAGLLDQVRQAAAETGTSVSATIAAALRRTLQDAEQAQLDAALEAQNGENLEWARAQAPMAAELIAKLEW